LRLDDFVSPGVSIIMDRLLIFKGVCGNSREHKIFDNESMGSTIILSLNFNVGFKRLIDNRIKKY